MEVRYGKIQTVDPYGGYVDVRIPFDDAAFERLALRRYDQVEVGFPDGRTISPEQRNKAYALLGEIAEWSGHTKDEVKAIEKHDFIRDHLKGLRRELFSLSDCDVTTAREYISYLIDFCLDQEIPTHVPLVELCDDVRRYVYSCIVRKTCAVCGIRADLHHVDRVGMGRDRRDICHIGMRALPLCREHHQEAHQHGDDTLMDKYHLEPVEIDERIAKIYRLKAKED